MNMPRRAGRLPVAFIACALCAAAMVGTVRSRAAASAPGGANVTRTLKTEPPMTTDPWSLAQSHRQDQVFSTIFLARTVEQQLSTDEGIDAAIAWCRQTGVTKVYIESFRGGVRATREHLVHARDRFRAAGFEVSGCVTTTGMADTAVKGKQYFPCFTYAPTQQQLQDIFEFTAPLFDEIMIDDFFATRCECDECTRARGAQSWPEYRLALMNRLSAERVLGPAHRANPKAKVIIKYPMWYEEFQDGGYDPEGETKAFDRIWVGTEIRDFADPQWGGVAPYRAYWIMRWLGEIGGEKCGGGWYDQLGTHPDTYLEQARQTILGGARESVLFCYPSRGGGGANTEALRREQPRLFQLAAWVKGETPRGVAFYKPISSPSESDANTGDWLGMVGIPLIPTHRFPSRKDGSRSGCQVAFFPLQAAHDPRFAEEAAHYLASDGQALFTTRAAAAAKIDPGAKGIFIFDAPTPKARQIPDLSAEQIGALRRAALDPLGMTLEGPTWVALYLFGERKLALENFRDQPVEMRLTLPDAGRYRLVLALGREGARVAAASGALTISLPPRTLACLEKPA